jgi:predicted DNA-binding ribbon-helix-helix protein
VSCRSRIDCKLGVINHGRLLTMSNEVPLSQTTTDLELALAFYAVLVEHARRRETLTYGQLVERAQDKFPSNEIVAKAIPVSVGRRLDFVRAFTGQRALPDLSSIVVNKTTGECGTGFTRNFDPEEARAQVFGHDWETVSTEFTGAVMAARERVLEPKKQALNHDQAARLMSDYYMANKATIPAAVRAHRETIIQLMMSGISPQEAFAQVLR